MKLIEQSFTIWGECPADKQESFEWIETSGRICYQSHKKGEPKKFYNGLCKSGHTAMVEHSNAVYRTTEKVRAPASVANQIKNIIDSKFIDVVIHKDRVYVGGNWRAWEESEGVHAQYKSMPKVNFSPSFPDMELVEDLNDIPMELKRITVLFKTSRAVTHEMVRHRPCSFAQESQRYCAYKDELEFIIPQHYLKVYDDISGIGIDHVDESNIVNNYILWKGSLRKIELLYQLFLKNGETPQQARHILPNATSTQIVITTDISHWWWLFKLRCAKDADPNMQLAMKPVQTQFENRGWVI